MQFNKIKNILKVLVVILIFLIIYLNCTVNINNKVYRRLGQNQTYNQLYNQNLTYNLILESECSCKNNNNKNEQIQIKIKNNNYYQVYMNNKYKYSFDLNKTILTCDSYNSFRRGMNQKVISYSLYGQNSLYYRYLTNITKQIKAFYPQWIIRIYHDNSLLNYCEIKCQLLDDDDDDIIDFCNIEKLPQNKTVNYMHKMNWRWLPIGDSFVDVFNSRDTDSFILQRELDSVQYWLKSNKTAHIMRGINIIFILNNSEYNTYCTIIYYVL